MVICKVQFSLDIKANLGEKQEIKSLKINLKVKIICLIKIVNDATSESGD